MLIDLAQHFEVAPLFYVTQLMLRTDYELSITYSCFLVNIRTIPR
ncbi:hypothetical protein CRENPOLYSF2_2780002 [Crenothrix polyspora]|uniref:Uncharacterized protein n=1 Tax=Crenothrix polyspora TaxID=360316 RepID=A0A1R4H8M2_9GAMM|nr:hypothetical protein CRENPOLYSF2_2780002 [Crenothrix polyspora]